MKVSAFEKLAKRDPRTVAVTELRLFAGLTPAEIAYVLGVSERTAESRLKRCEHRPERASARPEHDAQPEMDDAHSRFGGGFRFRLPCSDQRGEKS